MDKPNARELLREARECISLTHNHFVLIEGVPVKNINPLLARIDAYLAAPSESAMETVRKIRADHDVVNDQDCGPVFNLTDSEAAALIEDFGRWDGAMLDEIRQRMGTECAPQP